MGRALLKSLEEDEGVLDSEQVGRPKHMLMVKRLVDRVSGVGDGVVVGSGVAEALAVVSTAQRGDVSVVDGREDRDRSGSTNVLVGVLVDERLDLLVGPLRLVEKHVVVDGTSSALDGSVCAKVEVVLVRLSDASLNQSTRQGVSVLVTATLGEEADVVTL